MRKKRKPEEHGFNVWRSYSDMMAGVLLLFVLIMSVTLFQAQKSYQDSLKERDEKIALQEKYRARMSRSSPRTSRSNLRMKNCLLWRRSLPNSRKHWGHSRRS